MQLTQDDLKNLSEFLPRLGNLLKEYKYSFEGSIQLWDDGELLGYIEYEHGTNNIAFRAE